VTSKRDKLLSFLKESRGIWVSGEWLSGKLAVSRAAINKHVHHLEKTGLSHRDFDQEGILPGGVPRSPRLPKKFGKGWIPLSSACAISFPLMKRIRQTFAPRILLRAERLRGRSSLPESKPREEGEREEAGSRRRRRRYISFILRPPLAPSEAPRITLMTGVAATEALVSLTGLDARIKWPNDILVRGKKIAGILTEISTENG